MDRSFAPVTLNTTVNGVTFNISTYLPEVYRSEQEDNSRVHTHYSDEFFYIYNGQLRLFMAHKNQELILRKGDLCIVPKGMYHGSYTDYAERISFESRIEIDRIDASPAVCAYRGIQQKLAALDMPYVIRSSYIDTVMEYYRDLADRADPTFMVNGVSILLGTAMYAFENMQAAPVAPCHASVPGCEMDARQIIIEHFICEHFFDSACLARLAETLCLTQRQTSTVVQEIMKKSFKELIVAERMRVADLLIKSKQYTLEQVSEIVGYQSYSGFFTAYRKYYGVTPKGTCSPRKTV